MEVIFKVVTEGKEEVIWKQGIKEGPAYAWKSTLYSGTTTE